MKLQMKSMALLVAASLVGIFCYQTWWLVKLYQRETMETRRQIESAVDMADNQETNLRVGLLRNEGNLHGQVSVSASPFADTAYVESADDEHYLYPLDNDTQAAYRLSYYPVRSIVLKQMTGILCASAAILLVLCLAFWYLVRTILRQKTLDEMKTDFTNNITHELKTPIAVAYAANDALLNFGTPGAKQREYLEIAQQQLQQLSGMVEQILSMSMERRKTLTLRLEDVDVSELVAQQTKLHLLKADKPVSFKTDIQPQPLTLRADRTHLANMLSNLIDNAIKYSEGEAEVTICCRKGMIAVSDKGIGIARERLPHIFERFYRVPQGNRHDVKGYGLGLYYVQQMMLKHGGSVEAESQEGKGTTIRLIWNQ